jgi:hypothetical protein
MIFLFEYGLSAPALVERFGAVAVDQEPGS